MIFIAIALLLSLGCLALCLAHLRQVQRAVLPNLAGLARSLRMKDKSDRIDELAMAAKAGSWEHGLGTALKGAGSESDRIAIVNDALLEMEWTLSERSAWPRAAVRLCMFGTMLAVVASVLWAPDIRVMLAVLGAGGAGVLGCAVCAKNGAQAAARARADADALTSALIGAARAAKPETGAASRRRKAAS